MNEGEGKALWGFVLSQGPEITFVELLAESGENAVSRLAQFERWVRTGDGQQTVAESNPRLVDSIIGIYVGGVRTPIPLDETIALKEKFGTEAIRFKCKTERGGEIVVPAISESDVVRILELHGFDPESIDLSWSVRGGSGRSKKIVTRFGKPTRTLVKEAKLPVGVLIMFDPLPEPTV